MSNQLAVIEQKITAPATMNDLAMALGVDAANESQMRETFSFANSVMAEIKKTQGDPKKDLTVCAPDSIVRSMIDAARFRLHIDARQYAHLVKFGNAATLMIGYRGYLAKIKEHYPDADFIVEPVYKGDELSIWEEDGNQHYKLVKKSVFNDGESNFDGILFAVTYTDKGRLIRKVNAVPRARIARARGAAKQDFVWKSDYIEKAKAAAIKASCKVMFSAIQGLQDMIRYDNERNHDLEKPAIAPSAGTIIDNLNKEIESEIPPAPGDVAGEPPEIVDAEFTDLEPPPEAAPSEYKILTMRNEEQVFTDLAAMIDWVVGYIATAKTVPGIMSFKDRNAEFFRAYTKSDPDAAERINQIFKNREREILNG